MSNGTYLFDAPCRDGDLRLERDCLAICHRGCESDVCGLIFVELKEIFKLWISLHCGKKTQDWSDIILKLDANMFLLNRKMGAIH